MFEPGAYAVPFEGRVEHSTPDPGPGVLEQLTERQAASILAAFSDVLTPRQLDVVVLRYSDELTFEQIAAKLSISPAATHRLHARALDALRKRLAEMRVHSVRDLI